MTSESATPGYRVLVLEDEFIIADSIERNLRRNGHTVTGKPISYEEAVELYEADRPDLALIDVRLSGELTGIDFAHYLNEQPDPIPFVYLTSQMDGHTLDLAKETFPAGYLSKPVQIPSLLSTITVAMHNHQSDTGAAETVTLRDGRETHVLDTSTITYLEADHVYLKLHLVDRAPLVLRSSLSDLLHQLPDTDFVQTHRSYAVNLKSVTRYNKDRLHIGSDEIPISRSRRQEVFARL
ncbi:LytTR family DNA-binding domain-containing protein [Lewinella sp. JB7]|uniref:LytR/AlgR family response regulator transcription factor n=1 Tax=Lewinella sp. JB7 TaxID=2962887 RepID=UPI0020C97AAE|nr:LytTR family transcriptional regulator DNA-binding domain-containing protein [Lewinella sp. JB7]MCP9237642.1 LytTR family transcriptional regulator DNA-binding domain-containing protein [Lewinella sp. JB7]